MQEEKFTFVEIVKNIIASSEKQFSTDSREEKKKEFHNILGASRK